MNYEKVNGGWLMIDHRASPGIDEMTARRLGVPFVPEGKIGEFKTKGCWHCGGTVALRPDRVSERAQCYKCFHFICDPCALRLKLTDECTPVQARADAVAAGRQYRFDNPMADPSTPLVLRSK